MRKAATPRPGRSSEAFTCLLLLVAVLARHAAAEPSPRIEFFRALEPLCGKAFQGRLVEAPAGDTTFAGKTLTMHVRECRADSVRIPFFVGDDRSRTWVITQTASGIRLKHDHRHEDGTEDAVTMYGGDTAEPGTATTQRFPADAHTASLIPAAATNVWTVEIIPGERFSYSLVRVGTDRRFRIDFDLGRTVETPPAPWGWTDHGPDKGEH